VNRHSCAICCYLVLISWCQNHTLSTFWFQVGWSPELRLRTLIPWRACVEVFWSPRPWNPRPTVLSEICSKACMHACVLFRNMVILTFSSAASAVLLSRATCSSLHPTLPLMEMILSCAVEIFKAHESVVALARCRMFA
jgi:hypothetical protein